MANTKKLFEPLKIKNVTLKNRLVKTSQWFIYTEEDGTVGERLKAFYASIAKGGVGLIIVEETVCEYPAGASNIPHIRVDEDRFIPGLAELAQVIHKNGAHAFVQITHAGPAHYPFDGVQPVAPSALPEPPEPGLALSREITPAEIKEKIEFYAQAALRVKKAGFDGVEMHLAHYALGNAFLSRIQNKRTDEYGCGSLETRGRFGVEVLRRTRELVGPDFVMGVRMSAVELGHPLGTTNAEAVEFAKMFEKAGADYIQSSGYGYNEFMICWAPEQVVYPEIPPTAKEFASRVEKGALLSYAANIKKAVKIPVSGVGRLDYENGAKAVEDGVIDFVWLGRRLMVDPAYPTKVEQGRFDDIRPCTGCMTCLEFLFKNLPIECRWNTFMGNEYEIGDGIDFTPAKNKKKVMVVGAGPAGMEAARVAALRGHDVTLYEKSKDLGGLMPLAAFIKGTEFDDISLALRWFEGQVKKLGIKLELGKEVTADTVKQAAPDVLILATGSKSEAPPIPGVDGDNVVTTNKLKEQARKYVGVLGSGVLSSLSKIYLPIGKSVVVVGSDLKGLEAAEFLIKRGRKVTIVDEAEAPGEGMNIYLMMKLMPWYASKGVEILNGVKYGEINAKGIVVTTKEGQRRAIDAETVMIIEKDQKNVELYEKVKGLAPEVHLIGDAKEDKNAWYAGSVHAGARTGVAIGG